MECTHPLRPTHMHVEEVRYPLKDQCPEKLHDEMIAAEEGCVQTCFDITLASKCTVNEC